MRESQRSDRLKGLIALASLLLGACGTTRGYDGPEQPRAQIAVIQPAGAFDDTAKVVRVDGTALGLFDQSVEVLPGKHVVTLSISVPTGSSSSSTAQGDVELTAVGGAVYEAHGGTTGFIPMQHWFWIVDATTRALAGGRPPAK
jgi:hypothetical protein